MHPVLAAGLILVGVFLLWFGWILARISADTEKRWERVKEERNMDEDHDKAMDLLSEELSTAEYDIAQYKLEVGEWALVPGSFRTWYVEDGDVSYYEIDLNHGTVNGF